MKRVVITGIGALTPLGNDKDSTWNSLVQGKSGIALISRFNPSGLPSRIAGELKGFDPENYLSRKEILRLDPFIHYAVAAASMACEDAGLVSAARKDEHRGNHAESSIGSAQYVHPCLESAAVVIGSSRGGITGMENALAAYYEKGKPFSAYLMSSSTMSMASSSVSMRYGIHGPVLGISTACASGTNAIGEAFQMIRRGNIDIALAGGAEAPLTRFAVGGYAASGSLSRLNSDPQKASRPFDRDRDGFVIAEGAAVLVIEELDHAVKRGADIYAELSGYGAGSDAFHQTQPDSAGEAAAITKALEDARLPAGEVDYINAHATSTPLGDRAESAAIRSVFGRSVENVYVSSCKSMLGHMLGAAGAVEAAITALSIKNSVIVPSINLENCGPGCELNHVTAPTKKEISSALSNSFGFGGVNAVLVLKKYRD